MRQKIICLKKKNYKKKIPKKMYHLNYNCESLITSQVNKLLLFILQNHNKIAIKCVALVATF